MLIQRFLCILTFEIVRVDSGTTRGTSSEKQIQVEEKLKVAARAISISGKKTIDVKLDPSRKTFKEALQAFREANDDIQSLGIEQT